ncbi:hypothetical protein [Sagittula salina]|uniref:Uncharacterized protein n=1 Tax=Sagittula salina TaxID=2820268 RepID=A0A940ML17_9RHOB|nr:hypothetical protein [Sagittula salina]MBP0483461.1 hypothetical protein [Sagittula salina]
MKKLLTASTAALAIAVALSSSVMAETAAQGDYVLSTQSAGGPLFASIFGAPSAMTPPARTAFVSVSGANPRDGVQGNGWDYDMSYGYGFGNPFTAVGGMISLDITGTQPYADAGSFSLAFSRAVAITQNSVTFVGVSGSGLGAWAPSGVSAAKPAAAAMVSQYLTLGPSGYPVTWTVGYGERSNYVGSTGLKDDGAFWGVGVGATSFMSLSVSGTENQVNAGANLAVPGLDGLSLAVGRYDLADKTDRQQDAFTISYSMKLGAK